METALLTSDHPLQDRYHGLCHCCCPWLTAPITITHFNCHCLSASGSFLSGIASYPTRKHSLPTAGYSLSGLRELIRMQSIEEGSAGRPQTHPRALLPLRSTNCPPSCHLPARFPLCLDQRRCCFSARGHMGAPALHHRPSEKAGFSVYLSKRCIFLFYNTLF